MSDVWGEYDENHNKVSSGMIVARGIPYDGNSEEGKALIEKTGYPNVCPVLGDTLTYKSVSIICEPEQVNAVVYWLEYVHGGNCISREGRTKDGKYFLRSDYMCW